MSAAARFLVALANLLSKAKLYAPGHPAREAAFENLRDAFEALGRDSGPLVFSFLDGSVIRGRQPLEDLAEWPWSRRFAEAGIGRIELAPGLRPEELRPFTLHLIQRLHLDEASGDVEPHPNIRFGGLALRSAGAGRGGSEASVGALSLEEEAETVHWIHERASATGEVPIAEAALVVEGLMVALRGARDVLAPLLRIRSSDEYTSAHCMNVAILSMNLAEYLQFTNAEIASIGQAALLHDVGKTRIPLEVLNKPGKLTPREREIIERHPVEGARMLLGSGRGDELAAVVTYEHHMHWSEEGGYPPRHFPRKPHRFSRLVQVCDVYDALRTRRPFRAPLSAEAALEFVTSRAGSEFDPDLVNAFQEMMGQWYPATLARGEEEAGAIELDDISTLPDGRYDADTEQELFAAP